jgi:hypothetical protein
LAKNIIQAIGCHESGIPGNNEAAAQESLARYNNQLPQKLIYGS